MLLEFFLYLHEKGFEWFWILFFNSLTTKKLSKVWNMAKVIAALKANKLADNPGSYGPISMPCIPSKLFERLIYNRIKPVIESVLPKEKAGFQTNHCSFNQVFLFTEDIETSFDKKLEAGIVHVDLTASGIIA